MKRFRAIIEWVYDPEEKDESDEYNYGTMTGERLWLNAVLGNTKGFKLKSLRVVK